MQAAKKNEIESKMDFIPVRYHTTGNDFCCLELMGPAVLHELKERVRVRLSPECNEKLESQPCETVCSQFR
ncbi:hypothetical protein Bpfe_011941 [Biomphalaria pfeifferi]|uniref:Uncharacterized protein n=1 Tax=Biomphalaria pfeifferi TaxID=112525 RepID=A0AAD8BQD3_BIOPF|nr:hypothetical protein Bpfe_011941 [Biomphalaria pfeifferi]